MDVVWEVVGDEGPQEFKNVDPLHTVTVDGQREDVCLKSESDRISDYLSQSLS